MQANTKTFAQPMISQKIWSSQKRSLKRVFLYFWYDFFSTQFFLLQNFGWAKLWLNILGGQTNVQGDKAVLRKIPSKNFLAPGYVQSVKI